MAHGPAAMARSLGRSPAWKERQLRKANSSPPEASSPPECKRLGAGKRTRCAGPEASASATTVLVVPKSMPNDREGGLGAELISQLRSGGTADRPPPTARDLVQKAKRHPHQLSASASWRS